MSLNMIKPTKQTEDLLLSITKNCETLIKQTHRKTKRTAEFNLVHPRETFSFKPSFILGPDSNWMIGLISLEVHNSIFNTNTTNNKIELHTDNFVEFPIEELNDELEEIFIFSDFTYYHLQHEKIGPRIIQAYKYLTFEKLGTDGYFVLLLGYARSPCRDFESYLRFVVG